MGFLRSFVWLWILGLAACIPAQPDVAVSPTLGASTLPPAPSPTTPPPTVSPRPQTSPSPTITPRPTVAPLPEGFQTEGEWLLIFRPALERKRWREGGLWLTDGQRWFGPWPADVDQPRWVNIDDALYLCHSWAERQKDPICVPVPSHLGIQPAPYELAFNPLYIRSALEPIRLCEGDQALCFRLPDGSFSKPIRFPLPQEIPLRGYVEGNFGSLYGITACIASDQQHALVSFSPVGDPTQQSPDKSLRFPGALYWVDLHTGQVRQAPTNAPDWPAQQALVQSLGTQGTLPKTLVSLYRTAAGPMTSDIWWCSPGMNFAVWIQITWLPGTEIFFPNETPKISPSLSPLVWIWVTRLKDGIGYPLTAVELTAHEPPTIVRWVPYWSRYRPPAGTPLQPDYTPPWPAP